MGNGRRAKAGSHGVLRFVIGHLVISTPHIMRVVGNAKLPHPFESLSGLDFPHPHLDFRKIPLYSYQCETNAHGTLGI